MIYFRVSPQNAISKTRNMFQIVCCRVIAICRDEISRTIHSRLLLACVNLCCLKLFRLKYMALKIINGLNSRAYPSAK